MPSIKAPVYTLRGTIGDSELLDQLRVAFEELELKMQATLPIKNGAREVGFGVSKVQRSIAADAVIAITRAIKATKGW